MIYLGDRIDPQLSAKVRQAADLIQQQHSDLVVDMVPSYNSIHISFRPWHPQAAGIEQNLMQLLQQVDSSACDLKQQLIDIPVYYGPEVALDIENISQHCGLSTADVIRLFSEQHYRVYAIGFSPGFAYMGSIPEQLEIPRLTTPRSQVPKGSVAIADRQTAIYPDQSPGGWQVLGRTAINLQPSANDSLDLQVGDQVRFKAIEREEFLAMGGSLS